MEVNSIKMDKNSNNMLSKGIKPTSQVGNQKEDSIKCENDKKIEKQQSLQKVRYLIFLKCFQNELDINNIKQKTVWYSRMSEIIGDTNPNYCGEYHREYLKKFKTIQGIIEHLKMTVLHRQETVIHQIQRIQRIINNSNYNQKKYFQEIVKQKHNEEQVKTVDFQSIQVNDNCPYQFKEKAKDFCTEESKNFIDCFQTTTPIQGLVVINRQTAFRNTLVDEHKQKINEIIKMFKIDNKRLKYFKQSRLLRMRNKQFKKKNSKQKIPSGITFNLLKFIGKTYKTKRYIRWTKAEICKMMIFLNFIKGNAQTKKMNLNQKCSQYINTDINSRDCKLRISRLKRKYEGQFQKMIEQQTARFQIPQYLIESEKERYFYQQENPHKVQVKINCPTIKLKIPDWNSHSSLMQMIDRVGVIKYPLQFELRIDVPKQTESFKSEQSPAHLNKQIQRMQRRKYLIQAQVSNSLFRTLKNSLRQNVIYKNRNLLVLIHETQQIIQLQKNQ